MHGLNALQQAFRALVVDGMATPGLLAPGPAHLSERLRTYQYAYRARLTGALRDNYPVLWAALGDEGFDALAAAYIAAHPSTQPSIRWFGDGLVAFCERNPESIAHPALVDLVRMEWALRGAFDAADQTPLTAEALTGLRPEAWAGLQLDLVAALQWLDLDWAVEPLWRGLSEDPDAVLDEPEAHPHRLLVWRHALETRWRILPPDESRLLEAVRAGETFAALCEYAAEFSDSPGALAAGLLRGWLEEGLLAGCSVID